MILLDLHQTVIASAFALIKMRAMPEEALLRHMTLNSLRATRLQFKNQYGEFVICSDSKNYWRKDFFPYYKANRTVAKGKSPIDWKIMYVTMDKFKEEFREYLPYKFIQVDRAEADDVIAGLSNSFADRSERTLIISGDRDFVQLQANGNTDQWNPVKKQWIKSNVPQQDLINKIITGDSGDGIPNILSEDDVFINPSKRQTPMTKKRLEGYDIPNFSKSLLTTEKEVRNFARNQRLIDFSQIPNDVQEGVIDVFESSEAPSRKKLKEYFMKKSLGNLLSNIGDF